MHFFIFPSYNFKKEARKQTGHLLTGFFFVGGGKPFVGADAYIRPYRIQQNRGCGRTESSAPTKYSKIETHLRIRRRASGGNVGALSCRGGRLCPPVFATITAPVGADDSVRPAKHAVYLAT